MQGVRRTRVGDASNRSQPPYQLPSGSLSRSCEGRGLKRDYGVVRLTKLCTNTCRESAILDKLIVGFPTTRHTVVERVRCSYFCRRCGLNSSDAPLSQRERSQVLQNSNLNNAYSNHPLVMITSSYHAIVFPSVQNVSGNVM